MKSTYFRFRLSEEEKNNLKEMAKKCNVSQAEYIRTALEVLTRTLKEDYKDHGS